MSAITQIIRDHVASRHPGNLINNDSDLDAIMLLSCADMIDRLTVERNMAIAMVKLLEKKNHEPDVNK